MHPYSRASRLRISILLPSAQVPLVLFPELADTPQKQRAGLAHRAASDASMVFYPLAMGQCFTLAQTTYPLDLVAIGRVRSDQHVFWRVLAVVNNAAPGSYVGYCAPKEAQIVLETRGGLMRESGIFGGEFVSIDGLPLRD